MFSCYKIKKKLFSIITIVCSTRISVSNHVFYVDFFYLVKEIEVIVFLFKFLLYIIYYIIIFNIL